MHAASGLLSWSTELLGFASREFAPKIVHLSVRFIRVSFYKYRTQLTFFNFILY